VVVRVGSEIGSEGVIPAAEQVPGQSSGGQLRGRSVPAWRREPLITLSRTHQPGAQSCLPSSAEIADGSVEIVAVAREAGHRSRSPYVAVSGPPKGACIGPMGQRARNDERVVRREDRHHRPTTISQVRWANDCHRRRWFGGRDRQAVGPRVVVPDFQLSLATGKEGRTPVGGGTPDGGSTFAVTPPVPDRPRPWSCLGPPRARRDAILSGGGDGHLNCTARDWARCADALTIRSDVDVHRLSKSGWPSNCSSGRRARRNDDYVPTVDAGNLPGGGCIDQQVHARQSGEESRALRITGSPDTSAYRVLRLYPPGSNRRKNRAP
jgi:transcription antitermination factor NusA-like protein